MTNTQSSDNTSTDTPIVYEGDALYELLDNNDILRSKYLTMMTTYIEDNNLVKNDEGLIHGYDIARYYYRKHMTPPGFSVRVKLNRFINY
jgi:hypothetical protein